MLYAQLAYSQVRLRNRLILRGLSQMFETRGLRTDSTVLRASNIRQSCYNRRCVP